MSETQYYKSVHIESSDWNAVYMSVWKLAQVARDQAALSSDAATKSYWELEASKAEALSKRLEAM